MSETIEAAAPEAGTADDELRAAAALETRDDNTQEMGEAAEAEAPEEPEPSEEVEYKFGAKTLKVPKGAVPEDLAAALAEFTAGVQGDYTQKTQTLAEQRKAVEEQRELVQKLSTLKGEGLKAYATGQALAAEIQQLQQIDVNRLWQSNPDQARQVSDTLAQKQAEFQRQVNAVSQYETQTVEEEQRFVAKLMDTGRAEMQRVVKGFDAKAEADLVEYAVNNYGIPEQEARKWPLNPKTAQMAWKAMQFDRLQATTKAATAPKPPSTPAAPMKALKPGAVSGARDLASLADSDMEAFVREREKQERTRKGR